MDIVGLIIFFSLVSSFIRLVYDSYFYIIDKYYYIKRIIKMEIKKKQEKQLNEYHPDFEIFYKTVIYLNDEEVYRKIKKLKKDSINICIKFINEKLASEKYYIIDCILNYVLTSNNNIPIENYYYDILRPFMFCYELDLKYTKEKINIASKDLLTRINNNNSWKLNDKTRYELTIWLCYVIIIGISTIKELEEYKEKQKI